MRVAGDHRVRILLGEIEQRRASDRASSARTRSHLLAQPQPHVERDLLVAAAAGVDLVGDRAGRLLQLADDERMDVFVGRAVEELRRRAPRRGSRRTPRRSARARPPSGCRRAPAPARTPASRGYRRRSAAGRNASEPEKRSKTSDGPVFEPSAPELHGFCRLRSPASSRARTLIGSPIRLMKPSASFWS